MKIIIRGNNKSYDSLKGKFEPTRDDIIEVMKYSEVLALQDKNFPIKVDMRFDHGIPKSKRVLVVYIHASKTYYLFDPDYSYLTFEE